MRPILESDLCKQLVREVDFLQQIGQLPSKMKLIHLPNEQRGSKNKLNDMLYGKHLKAMGMIPGAADYVICYEFGLVKWLEMKRDKRSKQTESQKTFEKFCHALNMPYLCTYELDKAIEFVKTPLCIDNAHGLLLTIQTLHPQLIDDLLLHTRSK